MKNLKLNFAVLAILAGSALAVGTSANANASVKNLLITAGWYQVPATGPITHEGPNLGTSDPSGSVCETPSSLNCVAQFNADESMVSGTLRNGNFSE